MLPVKATFKNIAFHFMDILADKIGLERVQKKGKHFLWSKPLTLKGSGLSVYYFININIKYVDRNCLYFRV